MALRAEDYRRLYGRLAGFYDTGMWLYRLAGIRVDAYRRAAVQDLGLRPGDTVVDLGCGTGLNLALLHDAVGESGRIIAVDVTGEMLDRARERVDGQGWHNVELVQTDMSEYAFPADTSGVLATLALSTVADYDVIVARAARALPAGARVADFELKWPEHWPDWLARLAAVANRPAGVTLDIIDRNPAESIRHYFHRVRYREVYFGAGFICSGTVPGAST